MRTEPRAFRFRLKTVKRIDDLANWANQTKTEEVENAIALYYTLKLAERNTLLEKKASESEGCNTLKGEEK